ncbi:DUF397 domain-containing protein [Stackebrandtia nassauensis]|uniref:DUF397 domain-containing protein n=1 Tax=Stackebrandtia nassauensis (strain DSM 44728 / CIP 108903 / NRRL B-16338 / NBRC 102104 / LLR-40K-21) TaxID=446470 RepID=D3PVC2_STANL|nr:DUF397 domain-containing protein [Stackebrandtia nassauensis]ADD41175.1 protein of unknown function DUF397 [Stackebrandtia nassauensis DSM 44728]
MTSHNIARRLLTLDQAAWRKSIRSSSSGNGNCVEAASISTVVAIRDSKLAATVGFPVLTVDREDWTGFLTTVRTTA